MSFRFVKLAVFFAALHAICAMASLLFSFSTGMARFDDPAILGTYAESAASHAADFLFQPAMFVWKAVGIKNASAPLEWAVFLLNSALWGVTLGVVVAWLNGTAERARAKVTRGD